MHKYNTLYGFVLKCLNKVQVGNDQENAHRKKNHTPNPEVGKKLN